MSLSVRTTALACFLVVTLSACGGSSPGNGCDACATQESELPCGASSGCDEPGDPVPTVTRVSLALTVVNRSSVTRQCFALATWFEDGEVVTKGLSEVYRGSPNPESIVTAGASRTKTVTIPKDAYVNVLGGCFQPYASHIEYANAYSEFAVTRASSWTGSYFLPVGGAPTMEPVLVK